MVEGRADFDHLDRPGRLTALVAARPRAVVNTVIGSAVLLSWIVLAAVAVRAAQVGLPVESTPGDRLLRLLPDLPLPGWTGRFVALCVTPTGLAAGPGSFIVLWTMWSLMAVAMMLPSAAPMIRTYCEIAETAEAKSLTQNSSGRGENGDFENRSAAYIQVREHRKRRNRHLQPAMANFQSGSKGEPVAHPLVLVAGYLAVWIAAAAAFASLALVFQGGAGASTHFAAPAALGIAGLYQFSPLKEACLRKCRNPFAILFARWSGRPARIFRLGVEQGVWCLGCCWALMLIMFAVGVMNIFWMALAGLFTIVEKQWDGRLPSRVAGAILLVWAAALLVAST